MGTNLILKLIVKTPYCKCETADFNRKQEYKEKYENIFISMIIQKYKDNDISNKTIMYIRVYK